MASLRRRPCTVIARLDDELVLDELLLEEELLLLDELELEDELEVELELELELDEALLLIEELDEDTDELELEELLDELELLTLLALLVELTEELLDEEPASAEVGADCASVVSLQPATEIKMIPEATTRVRYEHDICRLLLEGDLSAAATSQCNRLCG